MHPTTDTEADTLDKMTALPWRNWSSFSMVLVVQALNAFNDNFVKLLLISLAMTVARDSKLGGNIELYLGAIFSLPYILFAPLAGWWSDRASKKTVLAWMQVAQVGCFGFFAASLMLRKVPLSLELSLLGFFFLATQAAFLSPAKMGVMKELVGSRRLGMASGWLQMTMMAGILSGMWAGGTWYGHHIETTNDPWLSAIKPLLIIGALTVGELVVSLFIQKTPEHPSVPFRKSLFWEHFTHLGFVFRRRPIRLAALGITYFWFVSNALSFILVTLTKELHPGATEGSGPLELARVAAILGVGVITGSLVASTVCKRRIELGLVPLGGFGLVGGMLWAGFAPLGSPWMYAGLIFTGAAGGCFMVPLYAFVQDKAHPEERARILSAINLMDCLATFVSVAIISGLKVIGLNASWQFIALAIPTFAAAIYVTRLVPSDLARLVALSIVRAIYKVKAINPTHVPREGGVLLLPNHVSYVDALIIGAACDRPVRFVMWDVLYKLWWLNWFLRVVGTVPISATRAKDAVRTVAAALKEGEVVCLFPEGQITRHGMINELRKGFELMARQAEVPVQPVYTDGLYGSIFSYEGGTCFRKWPKKLRYPVAVYFGQPLYGREGTIDAVRAQLQELSTAALLSHKEIAASKDPAPRKQIVANATRLLQVELAREGDTLLCLDSAESVIGQTLKCYAAMKDDVHFATSLDILAACGDGRVVAVGSQASCVTLRESREWARAARIGLCWDTLEAQMPEGLPRLARGLLDAATGALIATSVPDPIMPAPERDNQHGIKEGTLGRLLPGLTSTVYAEGIEVRGMLPGDSDAIRLPGVVLDSEGFLTREAPPAGEASE